MVHEEAQDFSGASCGHCAFRQYPMRLQVMNPGDQHIDFRGVSRLLGGDTVFLISDMFKLFYEFRFFEDTFVDECLSQSLHKYR